MMPSRRKYNQTADRLKKWVVRYLERNLRLFAEDDEADLRDMFIQPN